MGFETILFLTLGFVAILSAAAMVYFKNAIHSALFLIVNFGCVALLFLMLDAPFISMVQIAVYAGAIMVLFLFVIMLLGGEQTTDSESGGFAWVTRAATALGFIFVVILGGMAVSSGGFKLPEVPGANPLLRVVHSAHVTDPVEVSISGDALAEPVVLSGLAFSEVSDFVEVPAGDYSVTLTDSAGNTFGDTVTLANNEAFSAVAYGDSAAGTLGLLLAQADFSTTAPKSARMRVVNAWGDEDLLLVDMGANDRLDVVENTTDIRDRVLLDGLAFGAVSDVKTLREGSYALAFYVLRDKEYVQIASLLDWNVTQGSEQLLVITPDYGASTDVEGNYRPRVLDRTQQKLVTDTLEQFGSPRDIGNQLFTSYLLPVNLVGFLLLVALIGVIVLTRPAGLTGERRATVNRRRKVSRPLVSVISQQTGRDVVEDVPRLEEPDSGD